MSDILDLDTHEYRAGGNSPTNGKMFTAAQRSPKRSPKGGPTPSTDFDPTPYVPQGMSTYAFDTPLCRYRMILCGDATCGKSSLARCLQTTPMLFKSLPNLTDPMPYIVVPCKDTTITIQDYCDARFFPVHRAMYIFVWAMAPSGCLSGTDDARLRYWVDEVSARAPGSPRRAGHAADHPNVAAKLFKYTA